MCTAVNSSVKKYTLIFNQIKLIVIRTKEYINTRKMAKLHRKSVKLCILNKHMFSLVVQKAIKRCDCMLLSGCVKIKSAKEETVMERKTKLPFRSAAQADELAKKYFMDHAGVQAVDDNGEPLFDKNGAPVMSVTEKPLTVTGLALALGFPSRLALLEYRNSGSCCTAVSRALMKVEEFAEAKLFDKGQYSGAKFFLANNFKGWCDKPDADDSETMEKLDAVMNSLSEAMKKGGDNDQFYP